jgi:hypothetical protein
VLAKFELGYIVSHCISVMHKVDTHIGNNDTPHFQLYLCLFPHTLSIYSCLHGIQSTLTIQCPSRTWQASKPMTHHFIEAHAPDDDCHKLLALICAAHKPCIMSVQLF